MGEGEERQKVLIVDDQAENLQILLKTLGNAVRVVAARNGAKALELARSDPQPDLILLDVMMPEMDGFEVCARLKKDESTREIPVIFITGLSAADDEARGLGLGAVDFITKPINPDLVRARVRNHLELKRSRDFLRNVFGQFVSAEVRDKIISEQNRLVGERKLVAVLFSDIRSFTAYSERHEPERIVTQLNEYFERMVRCITAEGGVVDKFFGDSVMAVFGGLIDVENPCECALRAAVAMRASLRELNEAWSEKGFAPFDNGIGLHYGTVLQGTIGSSARKEFTIIGDAVNTAARLEALTKEHELSILCSTDLGERLSEEARAGLVDLGQVPIRGRSTSLGLLGCPDR
jgi:class 3 adenylate cyclase